MGSAPHYVPVNSKLGVNQNVPEGDDLGPGKLRMASLEPVGNSRSGLSDYRQLLNDGTAEHLRLLECVRIGATDKLSDVIGGLDDVVELQVFTPHRGAGPPESLTLGSTVLTRSL